MYISVQENQTVCAKRGQLLLVAAAVAVAGIHDLALFHPRKQDFTVGTNNVEAHLCRARHQLRVLCDVALCVCSESHMGLLADMMCR